VSWIDNAVAALLSDWAPHTRTELEAACEDVGASSEAWRRSLPRLRDRGFYVAYNYLTGTYAHVTMRDDTSAVTATALLRRSIPELTRRIRAHRGELIRATHHRGEAPGLYEADINLLVNALLAMGLAAGRDPAVLLNSTLLSASDQAEIIAEAP
jgi:hypothetical protein